MRSATWRISPISRTSPIAINPYPIRVVDAIDQIPVDTWNRLAGEHNPFLRHEFLAALEHNDCLAPYGWTPLHLVIERNGAAIAACPLYLKDNSYGELVFDHAWAEAHERRGLAYYPKLVSAIPYTPVTGARLLIAPGEDRDALGRALIAGALELAAKLKLSSVHWLFPDEHDRRLLAAAGLLQRSDTQFHWRNPIKQGGYRDFDDFLARLTASKRKKIRRERRRVAEAGVTMELRDGHQMTPGLWAELHELYRSTFAQKSGWPTLSPGFFTEIGRTMPSKVIAILARHQGRVVAGTFNMRGTDTFYGRHWGCHQEFHSLHFEACYYQPLEYCIEQKMGYCEAGAQGEHKLSRGFLPVTTYSAHWIADPEFRRLIADFLERERRALRDYREILHEHSPFRRPDHGQT